MVSWGLCVGEGTMGGIGRRKGEGWRKERGEIPELVREGNGKERGRL